MTEADKTLEEGYESLAAALRVKQEWQRQVLQLVGPLEPGEHLDAALDRIRELIASRQAWAEEALRLDEALDLAEELLPYVPDYFREKWGFDEQVEALQRVQIRTAKPPAPLCACVPDVEATALVEAGFTRPQCAVHPENGGAR
jgi:hypothetical protein